MDASALVRADARPWNSATTLYIGRALQRIAAGGRLAILDMGCGDGALIRQFLGLGHDFYGYDLPSREAALESAMRPILGDAFGDRIRIMRDERVIPFDDDQFDVVYANQVFEHVRFLDHMVGECARVLKPCGTLIALFPLATYPIEGHSLVPFVHWLPPGRARARYLRLCLTLGIGRRIPGMGARESAVEWDERLREFTFYRFMNEVRGLLDHYFQESRIDTGRYVEARLDLMRARPSALGRLLARLVTPLQGPRLSALVTHAFMGVFQASAPRPAEERRCMLQWRV